MLKDEIIHPGDSVATLRDLGGAVQRYAHFRKYPPYDPSQDIDALEKAIIYTLGYVDLNFGAIRVWDPEELFSYLPEAVRNTCYHQGATSSDMERNDEAYQLLLGSLETLGTSLWSLSLAHYNPDTYSFASLSSYILETFAELFSDVSSEEVSEFFVCWWLHHLENKDTKDTEDDCGECWESNIIINASNIYDDTSFWNALGNTVHAFVNLNPLSANPSDVPTPDYGHTILEAFRFANYKIVDLSPEEIRQAFESAIPSDLLKRQGYNNLKKKKAISTLSENIFAYIQLFEIAAYRFAPGLIPTTSIQICINRVLNVFTDLFKGITSDEICKCFCDLWYEHFQYQNRENDWEDYRDDERWDDYRDDERWDD